MDLNDPLGMRPRSRRPDGRLLIKGALGVGAVVAVSAFAFGVASVDPRGSEPFAAAAIPAEMVAQRPAPARLPADASARLDPAPTGSIPDRLGGFGPKVLTLASAASDRAPGETVEGGVRVFRGQVPATGAEGGAFRAAPTGDVVMGGAPAASAAPQGAPLVIDVSKALDDPLNRRGKSGTEPGAAKAQTPFETAFAAAKPAVAPSPRVAIFIGGMGLDASATKAALDMPSAVTLAFVPGASATASLAGTAKAKGHEILLQLPMTNGSGPTVGPHALKPGATAAVTKADLAWSMERVPNYDGVVSFLGAPVMADTTTMTAVLETTRARGLFFLDDGTSRQSRAIALAGDLHATAGRADVVLDATADPTVMRANLDRLVALARRNGSAIGMASGLPEHLGTIARFAAELGSKGVTLVPVGDLLRPGSEVVSAR